MQYFSQLDPRWKNLNYYNGYSFGKYSCFVTSLAMFCDEDPPTTASKIQDCFDSNGLLNSECAAQKLGLEYNGISDTPDYPCIAETTYFAPSNPQHFVVALSDGVFLDPLGKDIQYPIRSYRLFKKLESEFSMEKIKGMVTNFVIKMYLWNRNTKPTQADLDAHVNAIMTKANGSGINNALSDWLGSFFADKNVIKNELAKCPKCPEVLPCPPVKPCPPCNSTTVNQLSRWQHLIKFLTG